MKENELRIGNFVWDDYSGEMIVSKIEDGNVGLRKTIKLPTGLFPIHSIDPIPLTEEWLLRFGFEKTEEFVGHGINDTNVIYNLCGYCFMEDVDHKWFLCGYNWNTERMQYVHQLQNLYFALTGEELI